MVDIRKQNKHLREYPLYRLGAIASCKEAANTLESLLTRNELLESALKEISKGVGAYSQDQLTNAGNTIDSMVKIADKAIADCDG